MYAMSVSPLSFETLEKISPTLVTDLRPLKREKEKTASGRNGALSSGEREERGGRLKRARDFTNNIKIGSEVFEIETVKGKKQVKLPWEKLKTVMDNIRAETSAMYKGLRGVIILDGKYTLLGGEKLALILSLAPTLEIEGAARKTSFQKANYNSGEDLDGLLAVLPVLVRPTLWKRGKKELGFTGLFTDGEANYWVRCSRGFHTSLNESLASLETLMDELGDDVDAEKKHIVNQCYRRLSDYLG